MPRTAGMSFGSAESPRPRRSGINAFGARAVSDESQTTLRAFINEGGMMKPTRVRMNIDAYERRDGNSFGVISIFCF